MRKYFQAPWSIKDFFIVFSASVLIIAGLIVGLQYVKYDSLLGLFLIQTIALLLPLFLLTTLKYKNKKEHYGFKKIGWCSSIWSAFGGYITYIGISLLIVIFIITTNLKIPGYQAPEQILPLFGTDTLSLIIAGIIMVVIGPVAEEIFFRGFLLRTLSNKIGLIFGSITTATVFALSHFQFQSIIPIFILGLIINGLVIKKKSIWPAITFHILNNAITFAIEVLLITNVIEIDQLI